MGKEKPGFLTPKAIANRIKSKGLQKLRWYCQMCEKQCRDENGFKCHTTSESHQRQLLLFSDNSKKFMDEFSSEFHREYLNTLKRRFGTKRVHANIVYQEYINDRQHIHMNATRWLTLTDYVKWLGKKGICVVDETEKGWFVTYIDRDPETLKRQMEAEKKKKLDLDDRQRQQMYIEKQMEREKAKDGDLKLAEPTELIKDEDSVLKISFKKTKPLIKSNKDDADEPKTSKDDEAESESKGIKREYEDEEELEKNNSDKSDDEQETAEKSQETEKVETKIKEEKSEFKVPKEPPLTSSSKLSSLSSSQKIGNLSLGASKSSSSSSSSTSSVFKVPEKKPKLSALDEIMASEEKKKEKVNRKDYWLHKDIIVKIITSKLGDKYHKKKALVTEVVDKYTGVVKLLDTNTVIKLDQNDLETVLPAIGKQVLILNGAYRGETAILEEINQKDFCANVSIAVGPLKGRVVKGVQYEDISKLHFD